MSLEGSRRSELAELVANRILGHINTRELASVMHQKREADEFGNDRTMSRQVLIGSRLFVALVALDFGGQTLVDVRPFFQRPAHLTPLPLQTGIIYVWPIPSSRQHNFQLVA